MFVEDLTDFFDADEFGDLCTVDGQSCVLIFDVEPTDEFGAESWERLAQGAASAVPSAVARGSVVVRGSETFRVIRVSHDTTGRVVKLALEEGE